MHLPLTVKKEPKGNSLRGILINTNSVSIENATQLKATISYSNPDILFLLETKLDSSNYQTYSFLPPNYVAIIKDSGGVLVAFRDDITAESLDNIISQCENSMDKGPL